MRDEMKIREYADHDLKEIIRIWNEVVEEGTAFPQEETLDMKSGAAKIFLAGICLIATTISLRK